MKSFYYVFRILWFNLISIYLISGPIVIRVRSKIMPYQLVLSEWSDEIAKNVGENVFIDSMSDDYKVYLFYYPGSMSNEALESKLRNIGDITGKNLLVNIGRLNDPKYYKIKNRFGIIDLPVIILTALEGLATVKTDTYYSTAFVRIDDKRMLNSVDLTIKSVERLFNLFIGGEVAGAIEQGEQDTLEATLTRIKGIVVNGLKQIGEFLNERDITVSLIEGKFELKRRS